MNDSPLSPTINRDIEDIKSQVKREIETIRNFCDSFSYRNSPPGWSIPFELHRLRRALRIHYLAIKIRDSSPSTKSARPLSWNIEMTRSGF